MVPLHQRQTQVQTLVNSPCGSTLVNRECKAVSFASSPSEVQHLPRADAEELQSKWYSKQDYARFKAAIVQHVNSMGTNNAGGESICSRGIEFMTRAGVAYKKQIKLKVLAAVWNGQVRQWNEQNSIYDPESIAMACQKETIQCVHMAWTMGQLDQQAAMEEYQTMIFSNLSSSQANNRYDGGALQNRSNNFIGGDLQKEPAEQSWLFSNQTNSSGEIDLKIICEVEAVTLAGKRTSKSSLDGSSHGPQSPAKRLNATLHKT